MAKKPTTPKEEEVVVKEEAPATTTHPEYDQDLPDNKQRHTR